MKKILLNRTFLFFLIFTLLFSNRSISKDINPSVEPLKILFIGSSYFNYNNLPEIFNNLAIEILGIVVMPLGWFGIWEGFSKIVDTSPKFVQEEILFDKLSKAQYRFKFLEEADK